MNCNWKYWLKEIQLRFYENVDSPRKRLKEEKGKLVQTGPGKLNDFCFWETLLIAAGSWLLLRVGANSGGNYSCSTHTSITAVVTINIVDGQLQRFSTSLSFILLNSQERE